MFGATEDRAARVELFGDEIESIRWFSTFTQRSWAKRSRWSCRPRPSWPRSTGSWPSWCWRMTRSARTWRSSCRWTRFRAPLELIPSEAAVIVTAAQEIQTALRDHWDDVTTAMRDADARRLYVDVAAPLAERAAISVSGTESGQELSYRAQAPTSAARSMGEAESQLERELRSGYRVVVAFENRGEAERARYNLNRLDASFLDGGRRAGGEPELSVRRGAALRRLHLARPEARGDPLPPAGAPAPGRRSRPRRAVAWRPSPTCGWATTSSTRTTGSPASPASRRRPSGGVTRDYLELELPRLRPGLRAHRPAGQDHPLRRHGGRAAAALGAGVRPLGGRQVARPPRGARAGGRAAQPLRGAPHSPRPCVPARRRVAADARALLPLPRDGRPARGDRGGEGGPGVGAPDGPVDLRRRRLRQDRGGAARRPQGRLGRQAGDDAGSDHDPRPAAPRHLPRAPGGLPDRGRDGLAPSQARRHPGDAGELRRRARWTS